MREEVVFYFNPCCEPSCQGCSLTIFPLSFSLSESLSSRYMILGWNTESGSDRHQVTPRPACSSPLTCMWAPICVAVCPSSPFRYRTAAAAAGRRRRWSTCSWTAEAPPPWWYRARPPEGFQARGQACRTKVLTVSMFY